MQYDTPDGRFVFSDHFDQHFLSELYGSDFKTAEDVFYSSRQQIRQELHLAGIRFAANEIEEVRRIFHKIKPLFGYVGLMSVQDSIEQFEESCRKAKVAGELSVAFENITTIVREADAIIQEEQARLSAYNNRRA
jgi:HPt (histidine-containing phosphotransfer) domain-containing protein